MDKRKVLLRAFTRKTLIRHDPCLFSPPFLHRLSTACSPPFPPPFHCLFTAFPTAFPCLSLTSHCLSVPFLDLSLSVHRFSLTFHRHFTALGRSPTLAATRSSLRSRPSKRPATCPDSEPYLAGGLIYTETHSYLRVLSACCSKSARSRRCSAVGGIGTPSRGSPRPVQNTRDPP